MRGREKLEGMVTATGRTDSAGPWIWFDDNFALRGLTIRLMLNKEISKSVDAAEGVVTADVTVLSPSCEITLPTQTVQVGALDTPFIWAQVYDGKNNPLSQEIFLGRGVEGSFNVRPTAVHLSASLLAQMEGSDGDNSPGPFTHVDGWLGSTGLNARFMFRNYRNPVGGPHEVGSAAEVLLLRSDWKFPIPESLVRGGDLWISVQFLPGKGSIAGDTQEYLPARCVRLQPST